MKFLKLTPKQPNAGTEEPLQQSDRPLVVDSDDAIDFLCFLAEGIEARDAALGDHCRRMAALATALGRGLGLPQRDLATLQRAGILHDIGKIAIPDHILLKPGALTPDEWVVMKSHAELGERICSGVKSLSDVLPIIRHHHEKWDGSGYPDGVAGDDIPLLARIVQIADIYDALTTARSYKPAFSNKEAAEILRHEADKGWRDPKLVKLFVQILPDLREENENHASVLSLQAFGESIRQYLLPSQAIETPSLGL